MKSILLIIFLSYSYTLFAQDPIEIIWVYNSDELVQPDLNLPENGKLTLSLNNKKLTKAQLIAFLSTTTFQIVNDKGADNVKESSLLSRTTKEDFEAIIKAGKIESFDLFKIIGKSINNKDKIIFKPFLGVDKNKKSFVKPNTKVTINVVVAAPEKEIDGVKKPQPVIDCKTTIIQTKAEGAECSYTTANNFKEVDTDYDDERVVYIYDFNFGRYKKELYKFYKDNGTLKKVVVNRSTEKLNANNYGQIKVVNINRFLYNVAINDSISTFESAPSSLFNQLFIGDANLLGGLLNTFGSQVTGAKIATQAKKDEGELNALTQKIKCFAEQYNGLHAKMLQAYNPCSVFLCCNAENYHTLANSLLDIQIGLAVLQQTTLKDLNDKLKEKKASLSACNKTKDDINTKQKRFDEIKKMPEADIAKEPIKSELATLTKDMAELTKKLCKDSDIEALKSEVSDLENDLKLNSAIENLQNSLPTEDQLRKMVVFINHMVEQNQTYTYEIPALSGNRFEFTINIQSIDSIANRFGVPAFHQKPMLFEIPIISKAKPIVSFSSGSFIGIGKYLQNKTYDWQPIPNNSNIVDIATAKYKLSESGYSLPVMGFAALANIEWKSEKLLGWGLSAGVGLTIESQPRYAYLLGGSAFLGDSRQFTITVGVAAMYVNKLKNNLQAVFDQGVAYSTKEPIEYYRELKPGPFISLTYTPFKTVKR